MDIKDLKTLIKMVTETDITEFELESAEDRVVIRRGCSAVPQYQMQPASLPQAAPIAPAQVIAPVEDLGEVITSPIVGTFYSAPAPDSADYVEVGKVVEKGEVLCIVEAMKLMNEIEAEYRCKIVRICKSNAEPVEYGDLLFIVEKLG